MPDALDIEALAADWLARQDRGLDADERTAFDGWLEADIAHRVAWLRLEAAWKTAGRLAADASRPRRGGRISGAASRGLARLAQPPARWRTAAAIVVSFGLVSGLTVVGMQQRGVEMSTPIGARWMTPLADGSRVELNTDTALRVDVRSTRRVVWMEKGEAYFEVAHDPDHPFVIHAGKRQVTVLGTRFSVRRDGDRLEVVVAEGRVRVEQPSIRTAAARVVTVGDRLVAEGPSVRVAHVGAQTVADELAWRQGLVTFRDASLAEIAAELNRYNRTQMVVTDPGAGDLRIGGAFDPLNIESFANILGDAYGLNVVRKDGVIYISGPGTGTS